MGKSLEKRETLCFWEGGGERTSFCQKVPSFTDSLSKDPHEMKICETQWF